MRPSNSTFEAVDFCKVPNLCDFVIQESFVLPTIEDYSLESPAADKAAGHLHSNTSLDLMPPLVKKLYMDATRQQDGKLSEVSENP